jgi:hypothetical protein
MKKLVAVAALGAVLAAFQVTVAMSQVPAPPCYKGEAVGTCPK